MPEQWEPFILRQGRYYDDKRGGYNRITTLSLATDVEVEIRGVSADGLVSFNLRWVGNEASRFVRGFAGAGPGAKLSLGAPLFAFWELERESAVSDSWYRGEAQFGLFDTGWLLRHLQAPWRIDC
jgi:hypothetical protein